jgi:ribosome assembly protein RRB1
MGKKLKRASVAEEVTIHAGEKKAAPESREEPVEFEDDDLEEDDEAMGDAEEGDEEEEEEQPIPQRVFRPGESLEEGQTLDYDSTAYTLYHKMSVEWPCLSFDVIKDSLGLFRTKFPLTFYMMAGTQAGVAEENKVMLFKVSDVHRTKHDEASDDEAGEDSESDPDDLDEDPVVEERSFPHPGGTNRLRVMPQSPNIVATIADTAQVHVWDVQHHLRSLDKPATAKHTTLAPLFTFAEHTQEGFAMDWSGVVAGSLVSGDCAGRIHLWKQQEATWAVDKTPFLGHTDSVEDLQWSPNEATVFASCSVDKTLRIWDTRARKSMVHIVAHDADVNVISWNKRVSHLLTSGSDDGIVKVWDLRNFKPNGNVANFKWHHAPISSVEWHPTDDSVLAVASADNSISCWDLALENDPEAKAEGATLGDVEVPPQLLFVHQGQTDIKELHFHPQCPGLILSTSADGFNIFKPANMH